MRPALLLVLILAGCRPLDAGEPTVDPAPDGDGGFAATMSRPYEVGRIRVIDGDTFEMAGETIRIANIDAPERSPRSRCQAEAALAEVATKELDALLGASWAGPNAATILPTVHRDGQDRYGRTLARVVTVGGEDVGEALIARNAAVRWTGRRAEWCA